MYDLLFLYAQCEPLSRASNSLLFFMRFVFLFWIFFRQWDGYMKCEILVHLLCSSAYLRICARIYDKYNMCIFVRFDERWTYFNRSMTIYFDMCLSCLFGLPLPFSLISDQRSSKQVIFNVFLYDFRSDCNISWKSIVKNCNSCEWRNGVNHSQYNYSFRKYSICITILSINFDITQMVWICFRSYYNLNTDAAAVV